MARNKIQEVEADEEATPVAKKDARNSVTVTWRGGTRTYTLKAHGDTFAELAEEFAAKCGGVVA